MPLEQLAAPLTSARHGPERPVASTTKPRVTVSLGHLRRGVPGQLEAEGGSVTVFEHEVGLGACDGRIRRQVVQHELTDVLSVFGRDVDQEIVGTAQYEELLNFGKVPQLVTEGVHEVTGTRPKPHAHQGLERQTHRFGCDFDGEPLDHPRLLERLKARKTG